MVPCKLATYVSGPLKRNCFGLLFSFYYESFAVGPHVQERVIMFEYFLEMSEHKCNGKCPVDWALVCCHRLLLYLFNLIIFSDFVTYIAWF